MINVLLERIDNNEMLTQEQKHDRKVEIKAYWQKNYKKLMKYEKKIYIKKKNDIIAHFKILGHYHEIRRILLGAETIPFLPGENFAAETTEFARQLRQDTIEWYAKNKV